MRVQLCMIKREEKVESVVRAYIQVDVSQDPFEHEGPSERHHSVWLDGLVFEPEWVVTSVASEHTRR